MSTSEQEQSAAVVCYRHPARETFLRCNQCGKPICASCAVHTPIGYRCPDCIRGQQKTFETAKPMDFVWAVVVSGVIAFVGSLLVGWLGYFTLFLAPGVGVALAETVRWVTGRRRSKKLFTMVVITCVVAGLPVLIGSLLPLLLGLGAGVQGLLLLWSPLWQVYYIATLAATAYYRISGTPLRWRK